MKISAYLLNSTEAGSPYYAVTQFLRNIENQNIKLYDRVPKFLFRLYFDKLPKNKIVRKLFKIIYLMISWVRTFGMLSTDTFIRKPQVVVICREVFTSRYIYVLQPLYKHILKRTKVVWTIDDNIFESKEISKKETDLLLKYSDTIVVSSDYLINELPINVHEKVVYLHPTDGDIPQNLHVEYIESKSNEYISDINLIWIGSATNLKYLLMVADSLEEAAYELQEKYSKTLNLYVVCNQPFEYTSNRLNVINIKWSRKIAIEYMKIAHIGLMPLEESKYTKGKCSGKLVQYLTAGIPSIASAVGYNNKINSSKSNYIINNDTQEWKKAIISLSTDLDTWMKHSKNAYMLSQELFSYKEDLKAWSEILSEGRCKSI